MDVPRWVAPWVLVLAFAWIVSTWLRRSKKMAAQTRAISPAGALNEGATFLSGEVVPFQSLSAPLTGRPCAYFRVRVEPRGSGAFRVDPDDTPLIVKDGSGEALILPRGADLKLGGRVEMEVKAGDLPQALAGLLARMGQELKGSYHLVETIVPAGARVWVQGVAHEIPPGPRGERLRALYEEAQAAFRERHPSPGNRLDGPVLSRMLVSEGQGDPFWITDTDTLEEPGGASEVAAAVLENVGWFLLTCGLTYGAASWLLG